MKKVASEIKVGETIKSPFSPFYGIVTEISETNKKIRFDVTFTIHPEKSQIGAKWGYWFFKTTKVTVK